MCLRRLSLEVNSQTKAQASSRFMSHPWEIEIGDWRVGRAARRSSWRDNARTLLNGDVVKSATERKQVAEAPATPAGETVRSPKFHLQISWAPPDAMPKIRASMLANEA
jgi:hypothetical protein